MPAASQKASQKPAPFPDLSPASSPKSGSKRKLEEDEPVVPHRKTFRTYAEHQKHDRHYYLDGNILLQIGKTRFKVHRSRLASESIWFQALVDHYNGTTPAGNTVDKDVEDVVNEADNVGDDPLFFLDAAEGEEVPTADEFAALLTAIYSGIDYVFTPPSIDEVRLLYGAAWYYSVDKYLDVASKFLQSFFPEFDKITKEPLLHNAVQVICMGDKYDLEDVFPRALHDLARAPTSALEECLLADDNDGGKSADTPAQPATAAAPNPVPVAAPASINGQKGDDHPMADAGDQENADVNENDEDEDDEDEDTNIIKQISATHYARILILQRQLSSAWDPIVKELMSITCSTPGGCGFVPRLMPVFDVVTTIRLKYPCDPLLGIQELFTTPGLHATYCRHMKIVMNTRLAARKAFICTNLREKWTK